MDYNLKNSKILIVEDEPQINRLIELVLESDGFYNIKKAFDGKQALEIIYEYKPDLILLDVMIPEIDGFSLCKKIKEDKRLESIQIVMLTARKMEKDVLQGFENGAIDYISKPFSNKILLARIKAHLKTNKNNDNKIYKNISLDYNKKTVKINDKSIELTKFEFILLETFMSNIGFVFSRSKLLMYLRGDDGFEVSERAVDVQILNLRRKLGNFGACIETVRGMGYRLKEV